VRSISRRSGAEHDWSAESLARGVEWADAVVNLAGENLFARRWDPVFKQELWRSRFTGTQALATLVGKRPGTVLVSASAIGIYGDRGEEELGEDAALGRGFLPDLARDWEEATQPAEHGGARVVILRIGLVLGHGGALARMKTPFRLGVGGRLGSGRQWMSWIALEDLVALIVHALEQPQMRGVYNATAPQPCTNADFTRTLAGVLRRPALFPVPSFALGLALGEASAVLLQGQRVLPRHALAEGFVFQEPELERCLRKLL
jgi:uncharacterized protein (TIGR01777 family)